ncbi:MAG: cytochrome c3 family protein [Thermodesulfobacteriota bacterium]|nr:cytochrome c3 family protein [Thermodesulfobacteriota bacterium]
MQSMPSRWSTALFIVLSLLLHLPNFADPAGAFEFQADTAHGNDSYGVNRTGVEYATGECANCHETFDLCVCGENQFLLFAACDEDLCLGCHKCEGSCQTDGIQINKSYSCNFGGNADADTYDTDISCAFSHSTSGSSHGLQDIKSFAMGTTNQTATGEPWSLNEKFNPCSACHNPHVAQRDYNTPYDPDTSAISRPSDRNNLWGDDAGERMSAYTYQAPYWDNLSGMHEPANNSTADGSNMPDYPTFCTDCHNTYNTINSTNPCLPGDRPAEWGTTLVQINWSSDGDKHGAMAADGGLMLRDPYSSALGNKVLSCTDCHEPHGSKDNAFLIRTEVNDGNLAGDITTFSTVDWRYLCSNCHEDDDYYGGHQYKFRQIHHEDTDAPYPDVNQCSSCHGSGGGGGSWNKSAISCDHCHFHGGNDSYYGSSLGGTPTNRPTF